MIICFAAYAQSLLQNPEDLQETTISLIQNETAKGNEEPWLDVGQKVHPLQWITYKLCVFFTHLADTFIQWDIQLMVRVVLNFPKMKQSIETSSLPSPPPIMSIKTSCLVLNFDHTQWFSDWIVTELTFRPKNVWKTILQHYGSWSFTFLEDLILVSCELLVPRIYVDRIYVSRNSRLPEYLFCHVFLELSESF